MRILITGGAGFVGSSLAVSFKRDNPSWDVISFDNLKRRGSELTLERLRQAGITFVHGDIRNAEDIDAVGPFELLIDCAAEPSVHAGYGGDPRYLINTNLTGTFNALEAVRRYKADIIFLSSSRVYPISGLRDIPLVDDKTRMVVEAGKSGQGWSAKGISTQFAMAGARSLYGASKLAAEMLVEEYSAAYGIRSVINRCGVLTGPWQMGKVDQGFVVLWAARHCYGGELAYMGFGGKGFQVRDLLHVQDLYDLLSYQIKNIAACNGRSFNAGGGHETSVSLYELTTLCAQRTGKKLTFKVDPVTRAADIPYYVTDNTNVTAQTQWKPKRSVGNILDDVFAWLQEYKTVLEPILR